MPQNSVLTHRTLGVAEAIMIVEQLYPEDIRRVDYEEFLDSVGRHRTIDKDAFGSVLAGLLGFLRFRCTTVCSFFDNKPAFMATRSVLRPGEYLLCGIGWDWADKVATKRQRLGILRYMVESLLLSSEAESTMRCYVKNCNEDTLKGWRLIQNLYRDKLRVEFRDWNQDYTEVIVRGAY